MSRLASQIYLHSSGLIYSILYCSRRRSSSAEPNKDLGFGESKQGETWERVTQIRDKFEYDRERRMRERAFAPMNMENNFGQQNWKRPEARTSQGFPRQT
ncbi:unnamed protein product [Triticum turgidum subsp. durum]|uniref:Uncharacterized protein n=1 Tax=Triticum turgidum subsp. durum TaxID=4567 RepID=A0A9R0UZI6_TRITD|nr:unnamed protein product [Triticum turgidum subsp. durum]